MKYFLMNRDITFATCNFCNLFL